MPDEPLAPPTPLQALLGLYHCGGEAEAWSALTAARAQRRDFVPGALEPGAPALTSSTADTGELR
jgi:hypothetical protein